MASAEWAAGILIISVFPVSQGKDFRCSTAWCGLIITVGSTALTPPWGATVLWKLVLFDKDLSRILTLWVPQNANLEEEGRVSG